MIPPTSPLPVIALALGAGCHPPAEDSSPGHCRAACEEAADELLILLDVEGLGEPVEVQLNPCPGRTRLPDGATTVVALLGGFDATMTPVDRDDRVTQSGRGIVTLYPSFPHDGIDFAGGAPGDYRGTSARLATAAVLRYAADQEVDQEGCRLSDRLDVALSGQPPLLHGQSNGGNLALATLADSSLDLPPLGGITTFETPAGAQFVTVELGSTERPLSLYEAGSCAWNEAQGLGCAVDAATLTWDAGAEDDRGHHGAAFYDLDQDGACDEEEGWIWGLRPDMEGWERAVYSPELTQALAEGGPTRPDLLTGAALDAFWATRDGSLLVREAVARQPGLPFLILGTEQDHTQGTTDHPHITGLAVALQAVGAAWVRVNPDAAYLTQALGEDPGWSDNPANIATTPGDASIRMLPDEAADAQLRRAWITAAFLELQDRGWLDRWDDDLAATLQP
ncbi:MAG: hypothetical protein ABIO70_37030 [Pseudomonadota bacterium]